MAYEKELRDLGIRDHQISGMKGKESTFHRNARVLYHLFRLFASLIISALPMLFLNLPIGVLAGIYSEQRRKRSLARSVRTNLRVRMHSRIMILYHSWLERTHILSKPGARDRYNIDRERCLLYCNNADLVVFLWGTIVRFHWFRSVIHCYVYFELPSLGVFRIPC